MATFSKWSRRAATPAEEDEPPVATVDGKVREDSAVLKDEVGKTEEVHAGADEGQVVEFAHAEATEEVVAAEEEGGDSIEGEGERSRRQQQEATARRIQPILASGAQHAG